MYYSLYESPIGSLLLESDGEALTGLFPGKPVPEAFQEGSSVAVLQDACAWLDAYFRGEDPEITFPLRPEGTPFQRLIWSYLLEIPRGNCRTYGELSKRAAQDLGKEKMSAQAVGGAVGKNPICILVPCHRVLGRDGRLTGYAAGPEKKIWLLRHENCIFREESIEK